MSLDSMEIEPQPAQSGDGQDVTDLVVSDLEIRKRAGTPCSTTRDPLAVALVDEKRACYK